MPEKKAKLRGGMAVVTMQTGSLQGKQFCLGEFAQHPTVKSLIDECTNGFNGYLPLKLIWQEYNKPGCPWEKLKFPWKKQARMHSSHSLFPHSPPH